MERTKNRSNNKISFSFLLILCMLTMAMVPIAILFLYMYKFNITTVRDVYTEQRIEVVQQIAEGVDSRIEQAEQLLERIQNQTDIKNCIGKNGMSTAEIRSAQLGVLNAIKNCVIFTGVEDSIYGIYIEGNSGVHAAYGTFISLYDIDQIYQMDWYVKGKQRDTIYWGNLEHFENEYVNAKNLVPVYFSIYDNIHIDSSGSGFLLLQNNFFEETYRKLIQDEESELYILNADGKIMSGSTVNANGEIPGEKQDRLADIIGDIERARKSHGNYTADGALITYRKSADSNSMVIEIMSMELLRNEMNRSVKIVLGVFVLMLLFASVTSFFLAKMISNPLRRLTQQVQQFGENGTGLVRSTGRTKEVVILEDSFASMQVQITELIDEIRSRDEDRRILELKMLRNQINPHFLYNSLNSVRLMASMKGDDGIVRMVDSLGSILRYSLKENSWLVQLREALKIIESYVHIQNIRYKGCIRYIAEIPEEHLICLIPKFVLQPLVENSVLHGLLEMEDMGEIRLSSYRDGDVFYLYITDNGTGIPKEKLYQINMQLTAGDYSEDGESIGVLNVHRSIELTYGTGYGLHFESEERKYTKVTVKMKWGVSCGTES